jgi:hypothetical protein
MSVHCQFFHENYWLFEVCEMTGSLILIFAQRTRSKGSLILKSFNHQNQWFFVNSNNCTTLKKTVSDLEEI